MIGHKIEKAMDEHVLGKIIAGEQADMSAFNAIVNAAIEEVQEANTSSVAALETKLTEASANIETLKSNIVDLETKAVELNDKIKELTDENTELAASVSELTAKNEDLTEANLKLGGHDKGSDSESEAKPKPVGTVTANKTDIMPKQEATLSITEQVNEEAKQIAAAAKQNYSTK